MAMLLEAALSNAAIAAVLAVFALAASRRWKHPALAHALWVLVLVKLVTPPIIHVPVTWSFVADKPAAVARRVAVLQTPNVADRLARTVETKSQSSAPRWLDQRKVRSVISDRTVTAQREPAAGVPKAPPLSEVATFTPAANAKPPFSWTAALMVVWLAGSALYLAVLAFRVIAFRRWVSKLDPAPEEVRRCAEQVARDVGLVRSPKVVLAPGRISPMVWGFGTGATVLLPHELWRRLGADARAALLAHELAHLRRGDPWVRLLELSATALYWWHPTVWLARRKIHEAEELCCDAFVVGAMSGRARAYADALLAAVEFLSDGSAKLAPAASGIAPVETLQRRLTMIMKGETLRSISIWGRMMLFALAIMLLPMSVTRSQESDEAPPASAAEEEASEDDGDDAEAAEAAEEVGEEIEELIEEIAEAVGEALEGFDGERLAEIIEDALEAIDFARIGEAIEEALQGVEAVDEAKIEAAVEKALEGLDGAKIEEAIEEALEAVDEEEIEEAIERALAGLDEEEIERRVEEALERIEKVDIEGQIEEALEEIRELDIGKHIEEALEAIRDADIAKHIEEALSAIREADIEGAIQQALEGLDEARHDEDAGRFHEHAERAHEHAEGARERADHARERGREGAERARDRAHRGREQAERARDRGREQAGRARDRAERERERAGRERNRGQDELRHERRERSPREARRRADSDPERRKQRLERRLERMEKEIEALRRELGELSEQEEEEEEVSSEKSPDEI